jgi:hypothetical protein
MAAAETKAAEHHRSPKPRGTSTRSWLAASLILLILATNSLAQPTYRDFDAPPHNYSTRTPQDRFTKLIAALESGALAFDRSSEHAFLRGLFKTLDIPASSQLLVFSTTSLQLSLISPANPRAIYFNDDIYIGYIPGGRIELVALDPELGAIFYIFDIPRPADTRPLRIERSARCMNCHAGDDTGHVPGLVVKSVVPGPSGGSLTAYRIEQSGHAIPYADRFGGWHVTGQHSLTQHWGNLTGRFLNGELLKITNAPGQRFTWTKFPVPTSDILPHLILEHQAGFVNRAVEAAYRTRTAHHNNAGQLTADQTREIDEQADTLVRYLLFTDEPALPAGGVTGDTDYTRDFLAARRADANGNSLRDLDLRTRLFKHRCSYMIYSPTFTGLPADMKDRVLRRLRTALADNTPDDAPSRHLPAAERRALRTILRATLPGLPANW